MIDLLADTDEGELLVSDFDEGLTKSQYQQELLRCKSSPLYWMTRYVRIKTAQGEIKEFDLNPIQKKAYKALKAKYFKPYTTYKGETIYRFQRVRLIVCKFRQVGFSTLIIALILHDTLFWSGTESAIFLHKDKYAKKMLQRLKTLHEALPQWLKPEALPKDRDNVSEFSFGAIKSKISIGTPGTTEESAGDQGRSDTLNNVMISELPRYRHQQAFMQGLMAAVQHGNAYIESTALVKGDEYHSIFSKARRGENDWTALFYAWHEDPNKCLPVDEQQIEFIKRTLSDAEKALLRRYPDLTWGQIAWRRWAIQNDYNGNVRAFRQENPDDEETAFQSSGFNYFEDEQFEIKQVTASSVGVTGVFQPPVPGHFYAIGVDVAKGIGGDGDYSVIEVIDCMTQEQVYEFRSNEMSEHQLPYKIYEVWKEYQGVVGVEINNLGSGVMAVLRKMDPFQSDRVFQSMLFATSPQQDGFYTGSNKRGCLSQLYNAIKEAVRVYVVEEGNPVRPMGLRIASETTVAEMGTFLDLGDGRDGAGGLGAIAGSGNHDDTIMALMIAWQMFLYHASFLRVYREKREQLGYARDAEPATAGWEDDDEDDY